MKQINVTTPAAGQNTLRGTGKLDWTPSNKLHSTVKKLIASFDDELVKLPSKKEKITCPACGQKFKSNSGNLPEHKPSKYNTWGNEMENGYCNQKRNPSTILKIVDKVDNVIINNFEIKAGDKVAFTTYPWKFDYQETNELKEHTITNIYLMDNNKFYLELEDVKDEYIPVHIFVKNFIKL